MSDTPHPLTGVYEELERQLAEVRLERLEVYACAALTGILAGDTFTGNEMDLAAQRAWAAAEAMESERLARAPKAESK